MVGSSEYMEIISYFLGMAGKNIVFTTNVEPSCQSLYSCKYDSPTQIFLEGFREGSSAGQDFLKTRVPL